MSSVSDALVNVPVSTTRTNAFIARNLSTASPFNTHVVATHYSTIETK
jgi:hypothetical protein